MVTSGSVTRALKKERQNTASPGSRLPAALEETPWPSNEIIPTEDRQAVEEQSSSVDRLRKQTRWVPTRKVQTTDSPTSTTNGDGILEQTTDRAKPGYNEEGIHRKDEEDCEVINGKLTTFGRLNSTQRNQKRREQTANFLTSTHQSTIH